MPLGALLFSRTDPDRLIPTSTWIIVITLAIVSTGLFGTALYLSVMQNQASRRFLETSETDPKTLERNAADNGELGKEMTSLLREISRNAHITHRLNRISLQLYCLSCIAFLSMIATMYRSANELAAQRIAYRKLCEEQKKAVDFANNLINMAPIGVHSVNAAGMVIEINQTLLEWLGYTREEVVNKMHITELWAPAERDKHAQLRQTAVQAEDIKNMELNFLAKDGQVIPTLFNSKVLRTSTGKFFHSISTTYNYSERKQIENELAAVHEQAENGRQLTRLFMANMSHEIRTPLNAILGFSNLLARAELPPKFQDYIQNIRIAGNNLMLIVNDILDFEKIRLGLLRVEQIEFDLPGLIHSVFTMIQSSAEEKGLGLKLELAPDLPVLLMGDPMRLTQILINLLGNAVKFTAKGSVTLRASAIRSPGLDEPIRIRIDIADTGIGIPLAERGRIFERFTQASSDTTRLYGGTGLGLAIVKLIVELQQGTLSLVSEEGRGSTFTVELPYLQASDNLLPKAVVPVEKINLFSFSGRSVLLVEDNLMNRRIAEINLLELGLAVGLAVDGQDALEQLRTQPQAFDLVFMDIQMPKMDGYTAAQAIRTELGLSKLPIIALTAHVLAGEREKVLASGMNDYLTKPISHHELVMVLQRYLPGFWDVEALYSFTGDNPENFREIAELFIRQFPLELAALGEALEQADFQQAAATTHNLRSTTGYAGFQHSLGATLLLLEDNVRSPAPNAPLLRQLWATLQNDGQLAVALMQREIDRKLGTS